VLCRRGAIKSVRPALPNKVLRKSRKGMLKILEAARVPAEEGEGALRDPDH
jgi:hypothetical protein